jgi:hypothetical protein
MDIVIFNNYLPPMVLLDRQLARLQTPLPVIAPLYRFSLASASFATASG